MKNPLLDRPDGLLWGRKQRDEKHHGRSGKAGSPDADFKSESDDGEWELLAIDDRWQKRGAASPEAKLEEVPAGPSTKLMIDRRGQIVLIGIDRPYIQSAPLDVLGL